MIAHIDLDRHLSEMANQGYTVFESLFSRTEMDELDGHLMEYEAKLGKDFTNREVVFTQKIAERDENIRAFAERDEFVALSTALIGPDTDLYFNQKVYKNPHGQKSFSWHQDDAYGQVDPSPYLTVWIAINDATIENGCISVMPESHKRGFVEHWESDFGLACHRLDDPNQGVLLPLSAGSVACFWSLTMHKSGPNLSEGVRKAMVLQFTPVGVKHKASGLAIRSRIPIARAGQPARP